MDVLYIARCMPSIRKKKGQNVSEHLPELSVASLHIAFSGQEVVHGVSFAIHAHETVALVGESGCGKSVSALALARLLPVEPVCQVRGSIAFRGDDVLHMPAERLRQLRRNGIAYVFQDPATALHPSLRVGFQLCEAMEGSRATRKQRAIAYLQMAGLQDAARIMEAYPFTLSGGMQQRVVIAMALAREPALLVADEPTTALDVTIQAQILDLLIDLQRRLGMALLLITHNLGLVASSADRVCVMYAGHLVETGLVEDVLCKPEHPYTRGLLDVIPRMHGPLSRLKGIPGMVPVAGEQCHGCAFAPRCGRAADPCRQESPALCAVAGDESHAVACHFPLNTLSGET
jgi:oligopeptide/dipeptide ABC transporter ATP-binding protein